MTKLKVRAVTTGLAGLSAALGLTFTTISTAQAATAARSEAATATCGPSNAWVVMLGDNYDVYLCAVTTVGTADLGLFYDITSGVSNRIWLHQNSEGHVAHPRRRGPQNTAVSAGHSTAAPTGNRARSEQGTVLGGSATL